MSLYGLLAFSLVYLLAVATPGPGVAAVIAHSLARGTRGASAFIGGFLVGDLIWFTFAATGLAALAQAAHVVFEVVKYAGAAYLLYLAYRLWTAPVAAVEVGAESLDEAGLPRDSLRAALPFGREPSGLPRDSLRAALPFGREPSGQKPLQYFFGGLALTLANPKAMIFFLALLPTVVPLEQLTVVGFAEIALAISIVLPLVLGGYVLLAARARRMFRSAAAVRRINRGTGAAMACAAVAVASR